LIKCNSEYFYIVKKTFKHDFLKTFYSKKSEIKLNSLHKN